MAESTDPKKSIPHPSGPQTWGIDYYMFGHILYWRVQHMFQFPDDKFCEQVYLSRHIRFKTDHKRGKLGDPLVSLSKSRRETVIYCINKLKA